MNGRYSRQRPVIGDEGQEMLRSTCVGVAGCGGLGTTVVTALASAGIGRMVIVDRDVPEESNLNRQFVYREGDDRHKAEILAEWARSVNPAVEVIPVVTEIDDTSVGKVFGECDIVVDCLDNHGVRKVLNRYAVRTGKTLVHAGVTAYHGQVTVVVPGITPCLDCIYRDIPENTGPDPTPSMGAMVSSIASLEALQVIQIVTDTGSPFVGKMVTMDLGEGYVDSFEILKDPDCPTCSGCRRE